MPEMSVEDIAEYRALKVKEKSKKIKSSIRSKARSTILKKYSSEVDAEIARLSAS